MINLYHLKLQPFFHKHDDSCCCGHEHEHHDSCCCGHEHEHEHHDSCCCGHEHDHEPHHEHEHHDSCSKIDNNTKKAVFILENLGCANCASKMEKKIQELPDVYSATITFATRQLRLSAEDPQKLLPEIQNICSSIE